MGKTMKHVKEAVEAGYWTNFRYDPRKVAEGKNPLTIDSKEPVASYNDFIMSEVRYSKLTRTFPERAKELFATAEKEAKDRYDLLVKQKEIFEPK